MIDLLKETMLYVVNTVIHNAPVLMTGILAAAALSVYVDPEKMRGALMKRSGASIVGSVAFGAFTPFCACGTMAVIVSMMTTSLPWGPIMAFLTSSPLMSPDEFILYSGIVSVQFASALTIASIVIGLASGYLTHVIEKRTKFLENQGRFAETKRVVLKRSGNPPHRPIDGRESILVKGFIPVFPKNGECACSGSSLSAATACCATASSAESFTEGIRTLKIRELLGVFFKVGVRQVLPFFMLFAAIGFLINKFVPANVIMQYLGEGNRFAVPLLAFIGLPLYVNGSSALPIINALIAGGASHGALLAFMITGPGTSAGVIAGLVTIMKKRAIGLYVVFLVVFAIALGYGYDFVLMVLK